MVSLWKLTDEDFWCGTKFKHKGREGYMAKIKRWIANLKVAGKLKAYRLMVLIMTVFLVLVTLISTLVIRSNVREITEV